MAPCSQQKILKLRLNVLFVHVISPSKVPAASPNGKATRRGISSEESTRKVSSQKNPQADPILPSSFEPNASEYFLMLPSHFALKLLGLKRERGYHGF
jgi:hypothetical protein